MSSYHDDENVHYSEKAGTAEQQKHATRTYTYKSCHRGGKDDEISRKSESKIRIQVRNVSWSPIRASLVRELIGKIYDKDEARSRFGHNNANHTIKWTVDQRDNIAQLYTYNVDGEGQRKEGRPEDRDHPQGIWMQYNTLLGSGYVFNTTKNPNAREDILNKARELFVHTRPHPKTMDGDWTYVKEENGGKYKLDERIHDERVHPNHWTTAKLEVDLPWLASARTETIKNGVTSSYKFGEYELQVLNDCKVELDVAALDHLFRDYFLIDSHAKKWTYWRITGEIDRNGRNNFSISRYHPSDLELLYHTSSNKKVWITNGTTGQSYQTVSRRLDTTSRFRAIVHNESHWKLAWDQEKGRLTLKEIDNGKSKENEPSRSRPRSHYEGPESVYHSSIENQGGRRSESLTTYKRSPSVSSRGGNNQERATDDRHREYRPRSNRSLALSAHGRYIGADQNYIDSHNHHMAPTSGSSSGVESDYEGRAISFAHPATDDGGHSISSTHSRAQTQTGEPKEKGRKPRNFKEMMKYLSKEQRQKRTGERNHDSQKTWEEEKRRKDKRKEEKGNDKIEKKVKKQERKWEKESKREDGRRRNREDHSDREWDYERRERPRKPSAPRKLKLTVSLEGVGRR